MRTKAISNTDDVIDSRDVIERIETLTDERDSFEPEEVEDGETPATWATENKDDAAELAALEKFQEEAEGYCPDWKHGEALIRDSYFTEYAQELAEDIGAIQKDLAWPACHIDWDAAADALKGDYTSADFDGETYWFR